MNLPESLLNENTHTFYFLGGGNVSFELIEINGRAQIQEERNYNGFIKATLSLPLTWDFSKGLPQSLAP